MSALPTKDRVFLALRDGSSIRSAAKKLKIHETTAREHAQDLIKRGALVRGETGRGFAPGPKARAYGESMSTRGGKHRVGSGEGAPKVALRIHRGGCAFEIRGAVDGLAWESRWTASGVENMALRDAEGNRFWVAKGRGAPHRLMVQPTEEWVYDPGMVPSARAARVERVRALAAGFVGGHRLKFASDDAYEFQPVEYAAEMPGLVKFGAPGESYVWVDGSPGDGRLEMETSDPQFAKLMLEWPGFVRELREHRQAIAMLVGNEGLLIQAIAPKAAPRRSLPPELDPGVA